MRKTVRRLVLATSAALVTTAGVALVAPSPAAADPICAGVVVTSMLMPLDKQECKPYSGPVRCEFLGAGLQPTVYATVTVCVPAL